MSNESAIPEASESKLKKWLPLLITLGLMLIIFGVVLPQFIDYDAVFRAIGNIGAGGWVLLAILGVLQFIPDGWVMQASLPGLKLRQGITVATVTGAVANIPPGGLDLVVRYHMTRGWGFSAQEATASTVITWLFATASKLFMPVLAVLLLSLERIQDDDLDFLAVLGLVIVAGGAILFALGLRSTRFVSALGRLLTRLVHRLGKVFRRDWVADLEDGLLRFRDQTADVIKSRWHVGMLAALAGQFMFFLIMLTAVRSVGLDSDAISTAVVFASVAAVAAITTIPIFNAPGLNEALYISILTLAAGQGSADQVAAAVFVFRLITWLLPIPVGGISYSRWKDRTSQGVGATEMEA